MRHGDATSDSDVLTLDELVAAARRLSPRERLRLIEILAAELESSVSGEVPRREPAPAAEPNHVEVDATDTSQERLTPVPSLYGLWAGLGVDLSEEEIRQLRREAWAGLGDREI